MKIDYVQNALKALRPDTPDWYGWAKHDAQGNKIPNDQRMCWEHAIVIQDGVTKPSKEEFDAKLAELISNWESKQYQHNRAKEYPPITDYIDGVVKGDQAQIDKYIADCLAVKARHPKGVK